MGWFRFVRDATSSSPGARFALESSPVRLSFMAHCMLRVRIDDPLDAVAVHLGGGILGICRRRFFSTNEGILYTFSSHSFEKLAGRL